MAKETARQYFARLRTQQAAANAEVKWEPRHKDTRDMRSVANAQAAVRHAVAESMRKPATVNHEQADVEIPWWCQRCLHHVDAGSVHNSPCPLYAMSSLRLGEKAGRITPYTDRWAPMCIGPIVPQAGDDAGDLLNRVLNGRTLFADETGRGRTASLFRKDLATAETNGNSFDRSSISENPDAARPCPVSPGPLLVEEEVDA